MPIALRTRRRSNSFIAAKTAASSDSVASSTNCTTSYPSDSKWLAYFERWHDVKTLRIFSDASACMTIGDPAGNNQQDARWSERSDLRFCSHLGSLRLTLQAFGRAKKPALLDQFHRGADVSQFGLSGVEQVLYNIVPLSRQLLGILAEAACNQKFVRWQLRSLHETGELVVVRRMWRLESCTNQLRMRPFHLYLGKEGFELGLWALIEVGQEHEAFAGKLWDVLQHQRVLLVERKSEPSNLQPR